MWAVVPLKSPERAKTRLAGMLGAAQRRELLFELATRLIRALQATPAIERVAVVTASPVVADFARALGAQALMQDVEAGTAAAFAAAIEQLRPRQLPRLLLIAGDLPLVTPAALDTLCAAPVDADWVIVPDRHHVGTNALLGAPQTLVPRFGHDSLRRHLAAARAAELRALVLHSGALSLDLDHPDDFAELRRRDARAADALLAALPPTLPAIETGVLLGEPPLRLAGAR